MTVIHTPDARLRVFISSTIGELATERTVVKRAVERLRLSPILFELGARPHAPRDLYLAYLRQSDVFVGIYWQHYGWIAPGQELSGIDDEYRAAAGMPKLIYIREPAADRDPELTAMIDRIGEDGVSYRTFTEPDELETLVADDLAVLLSERFSQGARSRTTSIASRLPAPTDRFVGRDRTLEDLRAVIADPDVRLITLVGPGGIGKTRLAIQVAHEVGPRYPDGVHAVMLAAVRDPDAVPGAIREGLGLGETFGTSTTDQLCDYFAERQALLLLDNFEQVVTAASTVSELLAAAPRLVIVVTSREVLRLSGEHVFVVPPLDVPGRGDPDEIVATSEGVELFLDRGREVHPGFAAGDDGLRVVAEIVRRLEGIPLAIELAAARARVLSPHDLLARLDDRLGVLTGGPRDLPERQRTLRMTIQWSYDLLTGDERELFASLGVFVGGFGLASVDALCGDRSTEHLDALAALVDRSLVSPVDPVGGDPRFVMLETVREFAREQLEAGGRLDALEERHARHFLEVALEQEEGYERGGEVELIARLTVDNENLRQALEWFVEHGHEPEGVRLALALWRFWWVRSLLREGIEHMERVLRRSADLPIATRADASLILGLLAFGLSDPERAMPALELAHELYADLDDHVGIALSATPIGVILGAIGAPGWEQPLRRAVELAEGDRQIWAAAFAQMGYGSTLVTVGRPAEGVPRLERAAMHARALGTEVLLSYVLVALGRAQLTLGEHRVAEATLREALDRAAYMESLEPLVRILDALAALARARDEDTDGAVLLGAAEGLRRSLGTPVWVEERADHARVEDEIRRALGEDRFQLAFAEGLRLDLAETIERARAVADPPA